MKRLFYFYFSSVKVFAIILFLSATTTAVAGYRTLLDSNRYVTVSTGTDGVESVWFCYPDKLECDVTATNAVKDFVAEIRIEPRADWELLAEDGTGTVSGRTVIMRAGDQVKYRVRHKDTAELSPWGLVVLFRADAILDDVGETGEETDGAFLPEIPSRLSPDDEAFRSACRVLRFDLQPVHPPTPDWATLVWSGVRIFEVEEDGAWSEIQSGVQYPWNELASKSFRVAGSIPSAEERDHWIKVEHRTNKCTDTAWLTVVRFDLDIDTANLCGTSEPSRSFQEDRDEEKMAKIIQMNDMDADGDYIPDFLDGFGIFSGAFNDGEIENGNNFYPLVLECVPPDPEYSIRFDYDCPNNPSQTGFSTFSEAANAYTNAVIENPLGSGIRIWTKPESVSRNPAEVENGGDFVNTGVPIKISSLFPDGESKITLYIEGIGTIPSHVLPFIKVSLARSNGTDIVSDQVAYLVVRCVYYLCVYRPYVYDETNDARSEFFVDYATPRAMFSGYCEGASLPDKKFHKKSAFMGHAFARIQMRTSASNIDVWTGQTGMSKAGKDWSITDCLDQLRNGKIYWHSFPDGRQNSKSDLEEPWVFFIGINKDGYLSSSSNQVKPLTAVLEYRIPPQTAETILSYRKSHPFTNYGLDATIKQGASRCGCGSYIAILSEHSGLIDIDNWLVDKKMPIIPLTNSIPESSLGFVWKGEEEILEDAKTEFSADPNSAQWNTGEALQMKFADPGLMAKWIDEKNAANPTVNKANRNGQSIQLIHLEPKPTSIDEWKR